MGKGSTTARGYGRQHQLLAARLLAAWRPGDPCSRCGQPMMQRWITDRNGRRVSAIHLGHTDDRTGYTGLEHWQCNVGDGARRGGRARWRKQRQQPRPTLQPRQQQYDRW